MRRVRSALIALPLSAMVAFASGCQEAEAAGAPASSDPTNTVIWSQPWSVLCRLGCQGAAAWQDDGRVDDVRVRDALYTLSEHAPELREILAYNIRVGTRLTVADTGDSRVAGDYNPTTRVIRIHPNVAGGGIAYLGTVVAHELVHGAQESTDPSQTCQHEIDAYSWTAFTWERFKHLTGTTSARYDQVTAAWHKGTLSTLVRSWTLYAGACGVTR